MPLPVSNFISIAVTPIGFVRWHGHRTANASPRQAMISRCKSGMLQPGAVTFSAKIFIEVIPNGYVRSPGRSMASTSLQGREAAIITWQIIQCAYGMLPVEILSISITVILTLCLPWRGRPMGNKSLQLPGMARYRCGMQGEFNQGSACLGSSHLPQLPSPYPIQSGLHVH